MNSEETTFSRYANRAILGIVALAGLGMWYLVQARPEDSTGPRSATEACRQFVAAKLRFPGSAEFSNMSAESPSPGMWQVRGTVTAINGAGTDESAPCACTLRYKESAWYPIDVAVGR